MQVYKDLYNSAETRDKMNGIKERLEKKIDQGIISEISNITAASVKAAAATLMNGKADISVSYSSDAIRNTPDSLYKSTLNDPADMKVLRGHSWQLNPPHAV